MMKEEDLNRQIEKIVSHVLFKKSKRSVSFLRYICKKSILGEQDHIKEYSIGVDAFGLAPTFDPQSDPRVRVEARRLREKLQEYYSKEGKDDPILIEVPKGSYIAKFRVPAGRPDRTIPPETEKEQKIFIFISKRFLIRLIKPELSKGDCYGNKDYLALTLLNLLFQQSDNRVQNFWPIDLKDYTLHFDIRNGKNAILLTTEIEGGEKNRYLSRIKLDDEKRIISEMDKEAKKTIQTILSYCEINSKRRRVP